MREKRRQGVRDERVTIHGAVPFVFVPDFDLHLCGWYTALELKTATVPSGPGWWYHGKAFHRHLSFA